MSNRENWLVSIEASLSSELNKRAAIDVLEPEDIPF